MAGRTAQMPTGAQAGQIAARPNAAGVPSGERTPLPATPGLHPLGLSRGARDGVLYVPKGYQPGTPLPLVVMLHGAGGSAERHVQGMLPRADAHNLLLLAPDSRQPTWDVIMGGYGPDIAYLDSALAHVFGQFAVAPQHVGVEGFSDGASYALSLGVANGDLFTHIVAFSPGFMAPLRQEGEPRIFLSHGTHDGVLNIDRCSRRLVPQLSNSGYDVLYKEFDGPHTVPAEIADAAMTWFLSEP